MCHGVKYIQMYKKEQNISLTFYTDYMLKDNTLNKLNKTLMKYKQYISKISFCSFFNNMATWKFKTIYVFGGEDNSILRPSSETSNQTTQIVCT